MINYIFIVKQDEETFKEFLVRIPTTKNVNKEFSLSVQELGTSNPKIISDSNLDLLLDKLLKQLTKFGTIKKLKKITEDDHTIKFLTKYYLPIKEKKEQQAIEKIKAAFERYKSIL